MEDCGCGFRTHPSGRHYPVRTLSGQEGQRISCKQPFHCPGCHGAVHQCTRERGHEMRIGPMHWHSAGRGHVESIAEINRQEAIDEMMKKEEAKREQAERDFFSRCRLCGQRECLGHPEFEQ